MAFKWWPLPALASLLRQQFPTLLLRLSLLPQSPRSLMPLPRSPRSRTPPSQRMAKTISYSAPLATKTYVSQPAISYSAPLATKTYVSQPAISYAAPLATKTYVSQPALSYAAPAYAYQH
uniref:Uncharacterized protein n=1 Tax=Anopheles merus TaxID=30066 RepID=A0A182UQX5_ANOME